MSKASSAAPAPTSPRMRQCRGAIGNLSRRAPEFTTCIADMLSSRTFNPVATSLAIVLASGGKQWVGSVAHAVSSHRDQRAAHEIHHRCAVLFERARPDGDNSL